MAEHQKKMKQRTAKQSPVITPSAIQSIPPEAHLLTRLIGQAGNRTVDEMVRQFARIAVGDQPEAAPNRPVRIFDPQGRVGRGPALPKTLPEVILGPSGEIVSTPERNVFPDFTPVNPGLMDAAKEQAQRLSIQLGIPIRPDRILEAPWVGRTSKSNSMGLERNNSRYWSEYQRQWAEEYKLLGPGQTITTEFAERMGWPTEGPNNVVGDTLDHHHIQNGALVAAVPKRLHKEKSGTIHGEVTIVATQRLSPKLMVPEGTKKPSRKIKPKGGDGKPAAPTAKKPKTKTTPAPVLVGDMETGWHAELPAQPGPSEKKPQGPVATSTKKPQKLTSTPSRPKPIKVPPKQTVSTPIGESIFTAPSKPEVPTKTVQPTESPKAAVITPEKAKAPALTESPKLSVRPSVPPPRVREAVNEGKAPSSILSNPGKIVGEVESSLQRRGQFEISPPGKTFERLGTADMTPVSLPSPSRRALRGEAGANAATEALHWAGVYLNYLNSQEQARRLAEAKAAAQPQVERIQNDDPELAVYYVVTYQQVEGNPESPIQPGPVFVRLELAYGRDFDEALRNFADRPRLLPGVPQRTQESIDYAVAANPKRPAAAIPMPPMPFPSVALATFAGTTAELQDVEWTNMSGFDDEGSTSLSVPAGLNLRFYILQLPERMTSIIPNPGELRTKEQRIPLRTLITGDSGSAPGISLDTNIPFSDVVAVCVFPADRLTLNFLSQAASTKNYGLLPYDGIKDVRWVRPENIRIIRR